MGTAPQGEAFADLALHQHLVSLLSIYRACLPLTSFPPLRRISPAARAFRDWPLPSEPERA